MVTVTNFYEVQAKDGRMFISLELTGGIELVQSGITGRFYATVRKCRIPSTFDASIAKLMVGQQMKGNIVRVASDPYQYVAKNTGEVITLSHSWAYQPEDSAQVVGHTRVQVEETA